MPLWIRLPASCIGPDVPPPHSTPARISHMKASPDPLCSPKARSAPGPLNGLRGPFGSSGP